MSALEHIVLAPFKAEGGLDFEGADVFSIPGRHLLIEKDGHILLADDAILQSLVHHDIGSDIGLKLLQRGFASCANKPGCTGCEDGLDIHPVFFMIDLTNRCNMSCRYCLRDSPSSPGGRTISREMLQRICDFIAAYCRDEQEDKITVQPWGGEPLLETESIFFIQDELRRSGIDPCISIETNGLLLTDELIGEFRRRNICVSVSIDGPQHIHDMQRVLRGGAPTHSRVEDGIRRLQKVFGDDVSVIATVTRNSLPYIEEIVSYLGKDLKLRNIKINFVHKSSFADNENLCLTGDEISDSTLRIVKTLVQLHWEGYRVYEYNIWTKLMNLLANQRSDACISRGCHGGRKLITFDHQGDIYPCDLTDYPEEKLGTITSGLPLIDIIQKSAQTHLYFTPKYEPVCGDCPWYCYCRGGCTVHVKCAGAAPPAIDRIECAVNRALYPYLTELVLRQPGLVNQLLGSDILQYPREA